LISYIERNAGILATILHQWHTHDLIVIALNPNNLAHLLTRGILISSKKMKPKTPEPLGKESWRDLSITKTCENCGKKYHPRKNSYQAVSNSVLKHAFERQGRRILRHLSDIEAPLKLDVKKPRADF